MYSGSGRDTPPQTKASARPDRSSSIASLSPPLAAGQSDYELRITTATDDDTIPQLFAAKFEADGFVCTVKAVQHQATKAHGQ